MSWPSTGGHGLADLFDRRAEAVLDDAARAVAARQVLVQRKLDALLAPILDVGEADHVRRRFALGVLALVLGELVHALELERAHRSASGSSTWRRSQTKFWLSPIFASSSAGFMPSARASRARDAGSGSMSFGMAHSDRHRHARGEDQPVAVGDAATARRQLDRARVARLALTLEERRLEHLHVQRAPEQHAERAADERDEEARAPRRRLGREQRARRVAHASHAAGRRRRGATATTHDTPSARRMGVDAGCLIAPPPRAREVT